MKRPADAICLCCKAAEAQPRSVHCYECSFDWLDGIKEYLKYTTAAHRVVQAAIKQGFLPKATTQRCTDCNEPAREYDHRDYVHPLRVDPVCRACNMRRGSTPQFLLFLKAFHAAWTPENSRWALRKRVASQARRRHSRTPATPQQALA
jgi:hypothetical protein